MNEKEYIQFLHLAEKLKDNTRHSVTSGGREESVAEHSWRVALMAMLLEGSMEEVDFSKVLRMCVIHDLGEAVTGDIPSFWKTKEDSAKEDDIVERLFDGLWEPVRSQWKALYEEMLALETMEAKVYKALDKMEAVLQHNEAPISSWIPLEYELNPVYGEKEAQAHLLLASLRAQLKVDTLEKIEREEKNKSGREGNRRCMY